MNKLWSVYILLTLSGCIILLSGIQVAQHKVFWSGDETISYLCATGNQENFNTVALQTEHAEVNTTVWKNLTSINEPYCFEKIATELAISDLHPPLYFWLLHIYFTLFDVSIQAGVILNIVLHLLSLIALFALARKLSFTPIASAIICLLWALSPAALSVDFYARQYALLGLVHLLYAVCYLTWMERPTKITILLLVVCSTLGFLTHYSFIYTVAGYFIFTLLNRNKIGRNHIVALATTYLVAGLLLSLLHPHFAHQFQLQQERAQTFEAIKLVARLGKTVLAFCNFFVPLLLLKQVFVNISPKLLLLVAGLAISALAIYGWFIRNKLRSIVNSIQSYIFQKISFPAFITLWIGLVSVLPYLFFITPFHAMGAQYLVCLYPFMAILLYKLIFRSQIQITFLTIVFLGGSCLSVYVFTAKQSSLVTLRNQISDANYIICDKGDRRNIGRVIPYLQRDKIITIENPIDSLKAEDRNALVLISTYEKPTYSLSNQQHYYDFDDWGGFVVMKSGMQREKNK
ncbi:MAG: glycosyltransferase family 39 protein [Bacteroidota bacterium]